MKTTESEPPEWAPGGSDAEAPKPHLEKLRAARSILTPVEKPLGAQLHQGPRQREAWPKARPPLTPAPPPSAARNHLATSKRGAGRGSDGAAGRQGHRGARRGCSAKSSPGAPFLENAPPASLPPSPAEQRSWRSSPAFPTRTSGGVTSGTGASGPAIPRRAAPRPQRRRRPQRRGGLGSTRGRGRPRHAAPGPALPLEARGRADALSTTPCHRGLRARPPRRGLWDWSAPPRAGAGLRCPACTAPARVGGGEGAPRPVVAPARGARAPSPCSWGVGRPAGGRLQ